MHQHVESSDSLLQKRGYRLTPQRYLILQVIQEANGHISLDQIAERVQKINPRVSLSTVYRTLELLQAVGMVHEHHLPGEPPHYEIPQGNTHHHLVCQNCRMVVHLDDKLLGSLPEQLQGRYHFHDLTLNLVVSGYCDSCWQQLQHSGHESIEQSQPDNET